jgi:sugar phosphate isomerase/epimerase
MKLGLFSAAFPQWSLEQFLAWSAENGFEMVEIACWPPGKAERRYAGVTHIDVTNLTPAGAKEIQAMLKNLWIADILSGILSQSASSRS